jgi:hypothetical protein
MGSKLIKKDSKGSYNYDEIETTVKHALQLIEDVRK